MKKGIRIKVVGVKSWTTLSSACRGCYFITRKSTALIEFIILIKFYAVMLSDVFQSSKNNTLSFETGRCIGAQLHSLSSETSNECIRTNEYRCQLRGTDGL